MLSILKTHPILKIISGSLVDLPTPTNISSLRNFGSLKAMSSNSIGHWHFFSYALLCRYLFKN